MRRGSGTNLSLRGGVWRRSRTGIRCGRERRRGSGTDVSLGGGVRRHFRTGTRSRGRICGRDGRGRCGCRCRRCERCRGWPRIAADDARQTPAERCGRAGGRGSRRTGPAGRDAVSVGGGGRAGLRGDSVGRDRCLRLVRYRLLRRRGLRCNGLTGARSCRGGSLRGGCGGGHRPGRGPGLAAGGSRESTADGDGGRCCLRALGRGYRRGAARSSRAWRFVGGRCGRGRPRHGLVDCRHGGCCRFSRRG